MGSAPSLWWRASSAPAASPRRRPSDPAVGLQQSPISENEALCCSPVRSHRVHTVQCRHDNVIRLFEIYDEPKKMHLVMELVTGGELFDRIVAKGNYTEARA